MCIFSVKSCEILSKCTNEVDDLYTVIKTYHESKDYSTHIDVQHPHLQVQLRPYQRAAVQWMLHREAQLHAPPKDELHPLYKKITTKCGQVLYYNIDHGFFIYKKPIPEPPTPGGILADEMGLGKTVEVLSCMLANPRMDLHQEIEEDIEVYDYEYNFHLQIAKQYSELHTDYCGSAAPLMHCAVATQI
jgi:SNF2 family DNA or RNA helicase